MQTPGNGLLLGPKLRWGPHILEALLRRMPTRSASGTSRCGERGAVFWGTHGFWHSRRAELSRLVGPVDPIPHLGEVWRIRRAQHPLAFAALGEGTDHGQQAIG